MEYIINSDRNFLAGVREGDRYILTRISTDTGSMGYILVPDSQGGGISNHDACHDGRKYHGDRGGNRYCTIVAEGLRQVESIEYIKGIKGRRGRATMKVRLSPDLVPDLP